VPYTLFFGRIDLSGFPAHAQAPAAKIAYGMRNRAIGFDTTATSFEMNRQLGEMVSWPIMTW
jgi:hypothetical protein